MKAKPRISKKELSRVFEQGAEAWRRRDFQTTIDLLEGARKRDPSNTGLLLDLARAYGLRFNFSAANDCIEDAVRVSPKRSEALVDGGQRCIEFGNPAMASRFFERAVNEKETCPEALVKLAEIREHCSEYDEAAALISRALGMDKSHSGAFLAQARLNRLSGRAAEAEPLLRSIINKPESDETTLVRAHYELAQTLDRLGRFDEAMSILLEAKAVQRRVRARFPHVLPKNEFRQNMVDMLSERVLARWRAEDVGSNGGPRRRLAVLCGHPRSGTTLLEQMLDSHPEVISAEEKEILHHEAYTPLTWGFGESATQIDILDAAPQSLLAKSREDYFKCMQAVLPSVSPDKLLLDKNPSITPLIPAIIRIFPNARLLISIRDPRDVCLSCFMQYLPANPISSSYLSLGGTIDEYMSVINIWIKLRHLLTDQAMEVRYEKLTEDPCGVGRSVLEFLGLSWSGEILNYHETGKKKYLHCPSYADSRQPVYRTAIGRWKNYEKYFEPYLSKLAPVMSSLGYE